MKIRKFMPGTPWKATELSTFSTDFCGYPGVNLCTHRAQFVTNKASFTEITAKKRPAEAFQHPTDRKILPIHAPVWITCGNLCKTCAQEMIPRAFAGLYNSPFPIPNSPFVKSPSDGTAFSDSGAISPFIRR